MKTDPLINGIMLLFRENICFFSIPVDRNKLHVLVCYVVLFLLVIIGCHLRTVPSSQCDQDR